MNISKFALWLKQFFNVLLTELRDDDETATWWQLALVPCHLFQDERIQVIHFSSLQNNEDQWTLSTSDNVD